MLVFDVCCCLVAMAGMQRTENIVPVPAPDARVLFCVSTKPLALLRVKLLPPSFFVGNLLLALRVTGVRATAG